MRGRVLDVGCGAGRAALHLQERGHDVVAIDVSPGAVEVCRRRGVRDARVLALADVRGRGGLGSFDTIPMLGNNFESARGARKLLRSLGEVAAPGGRIVAETLDPYATDDPGHLAYHERNRRRGRLPGQVRIRIRHGREATPWFDYLFVSRHELRELVAGTGRRATRFLPHEGPPLYVALLERASSPAALVTPRTSAAG